MITIIDIFRICFKNIFVNKKRTFLTLSGIIIGIFVFVFFILISMSLSLAIKDQFQSFGIDTINIRLSQSNSGPSSDSKITSNDINEIKRVATNYKYVSGLKFYDALLEYKNEKKSFLILAYEDWDLVNEDLQFDILLGRTIEDKDVSKIAFGNKAAKKFFEEEDGDRVLNVFENVKIENNKFRVVGVLEERGDLFVDGAAYISFSDMEKLTNDSFYSGVVISYNEGEKDLDKEIEKLDKKLNSKNFEKFSFSTPKNSIERFNTIINLLTFVILFISSVSIVVSFVNIMNSMYSNVVQRKNQISTMKAIGATNLDIAKLFLVESFFYGLVGSLIGFFLAFGLAKSISLIVTNVFRYNFFVSFNLELFILTIFLTSILSMFFGIYPALKASKTDPCKNLNDD